MHNKAIITNIQRLSLDDGPGIRSTVFFKGCPLKCLWCHNPENISMRKQLQYNEVFCSGCGACAGVCRAQFKVENGKREVVFSECLGCGACAEACAFKASEVLGEYKTPEDILQVIIKDKSFYETSGGGMTLSGGEPLLNPDFCKELLLKAKQEGIETAVDTCGAVPWAAFETVLDDVDIFLYDIKAWDKEKHIALTGLSNETILENLRRLSNANKRIIVRMPLVSGLNDDPDDIENTARFIQGLNNIEIIELLPYHSYGTGKYGLLGIKYDGYEYSAPDESIMQSVKDLMSQSRIPVKIKT